MALTPEQKAKNKLHTQARDKAYRVRYNDWRAAHTAALAPLPFKKEDLVEGVEPSPLANDVWQARRRLDIAAEAAEAEEAGIREQIRELEALLAGTRDRHKLHQLAECNTQAVNQLQSARKEAEAEVNQKFEDVANVFSAAEWGQRVNFSENYSSNPDTTR